MKKTSGGKSSVESDASKTQKTLQYFFQQQAQTSVAFKKITCPACKLVVPESKLIFHLDNVCKSRPRPKKVGNKGKSVQKGKSKDRRKKAILSDSEDEPEEVTAIYDEFVVSDMVETQLFELPVVDYNNEANSLGMSQPDSCNNNISPYFSPTSKSMDSFSSKTPEKQKTNELSKNQGNGIAMLKMDWDSPQATPEKVEEPIVKSAPGPQPSCSSLSSPQTKSGIEIKAMLENDWDSSSPTTTPNKKGSVTEHLNSNLISCKSTFRIDSESDDFEKVSFVIAPPKKMTSPKKSTSISPRCINHREENSLKRNTPSKSSALPSKGVKYNEKNGVPSCGKELEAVSESDEDFEKEVMAMRSPVKNTESVSCKEIKVGELQTEPSSCIKPKKDTRSENDFQKNTFEFETQRKKPSKGLESLFSDSIENAENVSQTKMSNGSMCPKEESLIEKELAVDMLKGTPESSRVSNISETGEESLTLFSPVRSPTLVTPMRSPSPTLSDIDADKGHGHVRQLFASTSPSKYNQVSQNSIEKPAVEVNFVSELGESATKTGDPGDTFPASSQVSSTGRSPWKFRQQLKSTGILQHSPHIFPVMTPRKSPSTPSPSTSVSGTPRKDPAMYREQKGLYLENFFFILNAVLSQPEDKKLLNKDDLDVIETFQGLTLHAQKLYVRLYQRKSKWNKISKIEYSNICEKEDTLLYVNELTYASLLIREKEIASLEEVLQILSNEELHGLCKEMKIPVPNKTKDKMMKALLKFDKQQPSIKSAFSKGSKSSPLLDKAKDYVGPCCLINGKSKAVFTRILMLYGLPRYDDEEEGGQQTQLTTLLMVNMGKIKFPSYEIIREHSIFQSRDDLLKFEECSQIQIDVQECMEEQQWEKALDYCNLAKTMYHDLLQDKDYMEHDMALPSFLRRFTSMSLLVYVLTCSVECYQRLRKYQKAVSQLQELLSQTTHLQDYRGRWYDRMALNLQAHLKKPGKAVTTMTEALNDPMVREGHRLSISQRAQRMAGSARYKAHASTIAEMALTQPKDAPKVIIEGRSLSVADKAGIRRAYIRHDSNCHAGEEALIYRVEDLVLEHYKDEGYNEGLHREGTTVNSLFGLYFWDAIYMPVPEVFRSPHQATPLDLDDPNFYKSRKEEIDKRLAELRRWTEEEAEVEMDRIWTAHSGKVSMVGWNIFKNVEHVKGLVNSMGLSVLAAICERLARDHRFTRSGFPDLVVWNPETKKCRIVEVKGPNDRLSTKQILWLDYLLSVGAIAEVCHVEAVGAKKLRKASPQRVSGRKATSKPEEQETGSGSHVLEENKKAGELQRKVVKNDSNKKIEEPQKGRARLRSKKTAGTASSSVKDEEITQQRYSDEDFEEEEKEMTERSTTRKRSSKIFKGKDIHERKKCKR